MHYDSIESFFLGLCTVSLSRSCNVTVGIYEKFEKTLQKSKLQVENLEILEKSSIHSLVEIMESLM